MQICFIILHFLWHLSLPKTKSICLEGMLESAFRKTFYFDQAPYHCLVLF